jgi:hypothetical protein
MPTVGLNRRTRRRTRTSAAAVAVVVALVGGVVPSAGAASPPPIPVIIDTDLSRFWDDATAIGLANVLQQQGKLRILGIVSDIPNTVAVAAIDAINTAYGHGRIPVGALANSDDDTHSHGYADELTTRLPHSIRDNDDAPEAVALYRRLLARAPDHSVTIVSLGGYTNLARLLKSKGGPGGDIAGHALVAKKVKRLVIMDGLFPSGGPPFTNQLLDLSASRVVVGGSALHRGWPTPIAWVDGHPGVLTRVGGTLCTTADPDNPMRIVYEFLFECGPPGDGNWDAPALLYAIGDTPSLFQELGQGGGAVINEEGGLSWNPDSPRDDLFVHLNRSQQQLNAYINELLPQGAPVSARR